MPSEYTYIAMNRFGYGADRKSVKALARTSSLKDAQNWLLRQLTPYQLPAHSWSSAESITAYYHYKIQEKSEKESGAKQTQMMQSQSNEMAMENYKVTRKGLIESSKSLAQQTALANINHEQVLQSRLLDFFSNHFSVSRANLAMTLIAPTLEVEAIAPNLTGHFSDMLKAVTQHPAMLLYLNNQQSVGPNSKLAVRQAKKKQKKVRGLNENLAREILELHTLGVGSGYTQDDVIELAKAITGWSLGSVKKSETPGFKFKKQANEPGTRKVLGKTYPMPKAKAENEQGLRILHDLAEHAATAKHLSYKLAKHFIADTPSPALVNSMQSTWMKSKGHIPSVMETLIQHKDSWQIGSQKLKTPREFVISACRACGVNKPSPNLYNTLEILGHGLFNAGSPAGYGDDQNTWLGASALNSRIEWANHFASVITKRKGSKREPADLANFALGPLLNSDTLTYIKRAESKQQALALLLMSPDFQRR
jgi:uncharacterized protein (DUF1800 family)